MKRTAGRIVRGIAVRQEALGLVDIQNPFEDLHPVIDVDFMTIKDNVPTLLLMRDVVTNGLDSAIQGCYILFHNRTEGLEMNILATSRRRNVRARCQESYL